MDVTDGQLVDRARSGDREAMQELMERYQRRVLGVALGVVKNPDDALEVVQETFIRVFRSIGSFKGDSSFYTWVYRIAVNLAIDHQRRGAKRPTIEFDETLSGVDESFAKGEPVGKDPFAKVKNRELGQRIFAAIDELTPDHRAVILLREIEELSYEEISEVLECSIGTVMSRLHYARKKLQAQLRESL